MRVVIESGGEAAVGYVADAVVAAVRANPRCVLGLATGRTMGPVYARIAQLARHEGVSLADVTAFGLDEYVGAAPDDPWSFHRFALRHLVSATDLPVESLRFPNGLAADVFLEARRYDEAIAACGGIDLQLLGLGRNGHLGFNEPGSSLGSRTRVKALSEETLRANSPDLPELGGGVPAAAITMGLGTIAAARACLLIATGPAKAAAAAAMIEGPVTARLPASVLQHHPEATIVLDDAAAAQLESRDYYRRAEDLQRRLERERRAR